MNNTFTAALTAIAITTSAGVSADNWARGMTGENLGFSGNAGSTGTPRYENWMSERRYSAPSMSFDEMMTRPQANGISWLNVLQAINNAQMQTRYQNELARRRAAEQIQMNRMLNELNRLNGGSGSTYYFY